MSEDWLEFMLRRGEELARRLTITPTPPLSAAARHYVSTNLSASAIEEIEAGVADSGGRTPFRPDRDAPCVSRSNHAHASRTVQLPDQGQSCSALSEKWTIKPRKSRRGAGWSRMSEADTRLAVRTRRSHMRSNP